MKGIPDDSQFFGGGGGWREGVGLPGGLDSKESAQFFFNIWCGFLFVFLVVPHGMQDSISQPGNQT